MRLTRVTAAVCLLFLGCTELSRLHASPHPVFFAPPFRFKGGSQALSGFYTSFWKLSNTADEIGSHTLTNNNGVTFSAGKLGNAANFSAASSQSLSVADAADLRSASQFTITFWIKWSSASLNVVFLAKDSSTDREFTLDRSSAGLRFYFSGTTGITAGGPTIPADSAWHNVIAWYDGSVAGHHTCNEVVDNGTVVTVDVGSANPPTGTASFRIGGRDFVGAEGYVTASIDAVGWAQGKIPTAPQRAAIWNAGNGVEAPF